MKVKVLNIIDDKTFKAISTALKKHPKYGKYVTVHKKYLVDSAGKTVKVGDEVEINAPGGVINYEILEIIQYVNILIRLSEKVKTKIYFLNNYIVL